MSISLDTLFAVAGKSKRTFTAADRVAQKRLRALWDERHRQLELTQEKLAQEWDKTQGLISGYLNGHAALGPVATLRFARALRAQPKDIRPDFRFDVVVVSEIPPNVIALANRIAALPKSVINDAIKSLEGVLSLAESPGYKEWVKQIEHEKGQRDLPVEA